MTIPPGKTPISFLQELCTKRGITPQYDLLANEGAVHEPVFIMRVTVGDIIATGRGTSKKKAKHAAAQAALNQILGIPNGGGGDACELKVDQNQQPQTIEDGVPGNPVGELQEFTQKKLIKPPSYEFQSEQGPPHAREFVCIVKLGKFTEKGTGRSKKAAKRTAASIMLEQIRAIMQDGEKTANIDDSEDDDEIPLSASELRASYTALKEGKKNIPVPTPQQAKQIRKFYERIMNGKQINRLKKTPLNAPATNYCQMLQEIAEVERFEVGYIDIGELSTSGQHQCLVQLSSMPVAVCHGMGPTIDDSHAQAAHNALQYLKIMTKS